MIFIFSQASEPEWIEASDDEDDEEEDEDGSDNEGENGDDSDDDSSEDDSAEVSFFDIIMKLTTPLCLVCFYFFLLID